MYCVQVVLGAVLPRDRQVIPGRATSLTSSSAASSNNALPIVQAVEIPRFSNVPLPLSASRPYISTSASAPLLSQLAVSNVDTNSAKQGTLKVRRLKFHVHFGKIADEIRDTISLKPNKN